MHSESHSNLSVGITLHFVIPDRRSLPVRNLLLSRPKAGPRAIKLLFGMTKSLKLHHYPLLGKLQIKASQVTKAFPASRL
jgi:hypothetical protein